MNGVELVAATSDIGFVTDERGVIHGWNPEAEEALDIAAEEAIGKSCSEVLKGRDRFGNDYCGPNCPLMRMAAEGRRVRRCELFIAGGDGIARPYSVMIMLLRGVPPLDPAVIHLLHPLVSEGSPTTGREVSRISGNHQRGELTKRELEVLTLLGKGTGTEAIARRLCISRATASNHIQHILYKLKAHNRLEAVAIARELRLL